MLRLRGTLFSIVGLGLSLWHAPRPRPRRPSRTTSTGSSRRPAREPGDGPSRRALQPDRPAADRFGQLQNACEWTRDRFVEFGIENARLEPWGEFPVGFNRGPVVRPGRRARAERPCSSSPCRGRPARRGSSAARRSSPRTTRRSSNKVKDEPRRRLGRRAPLPRRGAARDGRTPGRFRKKLGEGLRRARSRRHRSPAAPGELVVTGGNLPDHLGQAARPSPRSPCCRSSSTRSSAGSRTASRSRSSSTSATTSRRGRSRSTT